MTPDSVYCRNAPLGDAVHESAVTGWVVEQQLVSRPVTPPTVPPLAVHFVAVERMRYNDAVREYNAYIKSFPTALYAASLGFKPEKYFEAPPEAQKAPRVDFGTRPPE